MLKTSFICFSPIFFNTYKITKIRKTYTLVFVLQRRNISIWLHGIFFLYQMSKTAMQFGWFWGVKSKYLMQKEIFFYKYTCTNILNIPRMNLM